jgi:hypothetical protein
MDIDNRQIKIILLWILIGFIVFLIYYNWFAPIWEGFVGNSYPLEIQNVASARASLPLVQCSIKASYNSAYDGSNITTDALRHVLSRGCRFLDFEIYSIDEKPVVGYSTDPTYSSLTSSNSLPFQTLMETVITDGFGGTAPNTRDPVFIHLRIKTQCHLGSSGTSSCEIYRQVADILQTALSSRLYQDDQGKAIPVDGSTPLSDIAEKAIIVMDASINRDYKNLGKCDVPADAATAATTCISLNHLVNIETGGSAWKKFNYSDFLNKTTNTLVVDSHDVNIAEPSQGILTLQAVFPDMPKNVQNSIFPLSHMLTYGCQTVLYKYYNDDDALHKAEDLFNEYKTAFVPLGLVAHYLGQDSSKYA